MVLREARTRSLASLTLTLTSSSIKPETYCSSGQQLSLPYSNRRAPSTPGACLHSSLSPSSSLCLHLCLSKRGVQVPPLFPFWSTNFSRILLLSAFKDDFYFVILAHFTLGRMDSGKLCSLASFVRSFVPLDFHFTESFENLLIKTEQTQLVVSVLHSPRPRRSSSAFGQASSLWRVGVCSFLLSPGRSGDFETIKD